MTHPTKSGRSADDPIADNALFCEHPSYQRCLGKNMMKVVETFLVCASGLALLMLAYWATHSPSVTRLTFVHFNRSSAADFADVRNCLEKEIGKLLFSNFKPLSPSVAKGRGASPIYFSTYYDGVSAKLIVEKANGGTTIRLIAEQAPSDDEADLLAWCLVEPRTPWIPREVREQG